MPPGGPPVTDTDRQRVRDLHAQGLARNAIAARIGRSRATVSKIASEEGLSFDRSATAEATRAKVVDAKQRRANLAEAALDDADTMRQRAVAADNGRDARDYAQAFATLIDRHIRLVELDSDKQGLTAVDAWLRGMIGPSS